MAWSEEFTFDRKVYNIIIFLGSTAKIQWYNTYNYISIPKYDMTPDTAL